MKNERSIRLEGRGHLETYFMHNIKSKDQELKMYLTDQTNDVKNLSQPIKETVHLSVIQYTR